MRNASLCHLPKQEIAMYEYRERRRAMIVEASDASDA